MFNALREGSMFYILRKGETPFLKIGQVTYKSEPRLKNELQTAPYGFPQNTVIDIKVKADNEDYEFNALDTNSSVCAYPEKNFFITDSREQMLAEVESMMKTSSQVLESIPYHESVKSACADMILRLNPQLAKEKEQAEKISTLENKISGMEGALTNIQEMLSKALNNNRK